MAPLLPPPLMRRSVLVGPPRPTQATQAAQAILCQAALRSGVTRIQHRRQSSDSREPASSNKLEGTFNKTGVKEADDPLKIEMRSDEYSKSGGDDIVAAQSIASFKSMYTTDPAYEKDIAGRGNKINPLEISPASPEVSRIVKEQFVENNVERDPSAKTGPGITRKTKRVEHTEIDFRPK